MGNISLADLVGAEEAESTSLYALSFFSSHHQSGQDQLSESENSRNLADLALKLGGGPVHTEEHLWGSTLFLSKRREKCVTAEGSGMCLQLSFHRLVRRRDVRRSLKCQRSCPTLGGGSWRQVGEPDLSHTLWASLALSLELSPTDLIISACFYLLDGGAVYDTVLPLC